MKPPRPTIAGLMGLTALAAILVASLREPSQVWAGLLFTLSYGLNLLAIVTVLLGRRRARAAATGYAVCGGGYFLFCFVGPGVDDPWLLSSTLVSVAVDALALGTDEQYLLLRAADALASIASGASGAAYALFLTRDRPGPELNPGSGRTTTTSVDQP